MKILNVTKTIIYEIETDTIGYNEYERSEDGMWRVWMGDQTFPCYEEEDELEEVYLEYLSLREEE